MLKEGLEGEIETEYEAEIMAVQPRIMMVI